MLCLCSLMRRNEFCKKSKRSWKRGETNVQDRTSFSTSSENTSNRFHDRRKVRWSFRASSVKKLSSYELSSLFLSVRPSPEVDSTRSVTSCIMAITVYIEMSVRQEISRGRKGKKRGRRKFLSSRLSRSGMEKNSGSILHGWEIQRERNGQAAGNMKF